MKIEKYNKVEDENRPFIQINDNDVKKNCKYWGGQTRLENTAGTFSIYLATYNIGSDPLHENIKK